MKPRCLLIAPTKYFYKEVAPEPVKYYLLTLLSHLDDLAEVELLDLEMRFGYPQSEADIAAFLAGAEELIRGCRPDVIGISCYTSYDYLGSVDLLRLCRRLHPRALLVVGGYHPTAVPEDFFAEPVDYIVRGEGEIALREILERGRPGSATVVDGPALDLREERPLRYDLYPYRSDDVTLALSRGCVYRCTFCVQSDDFPNHYRRLDLAQIREKILRLRAHGPVRRIMFVDPFFGVHRRQTAELLDLLAEVAPDVSFWAETRIDRAHEEWLRKLSLLKLDLHFGVESLAEDTLRLMRKANSPRRYIESFFSTLDLCQREGVLARCGFIMNYPGELPESYAETISRIRQAVDRYDQVHFTFHCNQYALYPGNHIYHVRHQLDEERGFRFPNDGWWRVREPAVRKRSEQCLASRGLAEAFQGRPGFWTGDVLGLLKRYAAKYSFEAFCFYRRDEILESLRHHYQGRRDIPEWDEEPCREELALVRHLRFRLRDVFYLYEGWLRRSFPERAAAFARLFHAVTFRYQERLLDQYDAGAGPGHLHHGIDLFHRTLLDEMEENVCRAVAGREGLELRLLGEVYLLLPGDEVRQLAPAGQETSA